MVGTSVVGVTASDFNADGVLDLAGPTGVALGNGNGTFQTEIPYALDLDYLAAMTSLDLDRDGKLDLLALNGYGTLSILRGNANGTFQSRLVYSTEEQQTRLVLGDFDHDGFTDVALAGYGSAVSVLRQQGCVE